VTPSFPINQFPIRNTLRNNQTYTIINASYEGNVLSLKRKDNTALVLLLFNCSQVFKIFYDKPLNIVVDDCYI